jgi:nicotinamide-nucleotide amidase
MAELMSLYSPELLQSAHALVVDLTARELRLVTAESCTGGLLAGLLTEIPGASRVLERGFVVYSNEAKAEAVGVEPVLIMAHGAVSAQVAVALAEGALERSAADIAVAITGVAGPDGGSEAKPVGLVHLAAARRDGPTLAREMRYGDRGRTAIRLAAVADALQLIREQIPAQ